MWLFLPHSAHNDDEGKMGGLFQALLKVRVLDCLAGLTAFEALLVIGDITESAFLSGVDSLVAGSTLV